MCRRLVDGGNLTGSIMAGLTPKQEAFALAYIETGNAAEAYRRAYDVKAQTQHATIYVAASRLLDDPKIALRVDELRNRAVNRVLYTVEQAFAEYEDARQLALQEANPSAAVSAVTGKVKLFGLDQPQKVDVAIQPQALDASKLSTAALRELMGAMSDEGTDPDQGGPAGD